MVKFIKFTKPVMTSNFTSGLASHYVNISQISDARWASTTTATFRVNKNFLTTRDLLTLTTNAASTDTIVSIVDAIAKASTNGFTNVFNICIYDTLPNPPSTINSIVLG